MNEELSADQMKPADNKIITTAKCPICGEMAEVRKFGKGQGRISHHGHTVCFSSREVRALTAPGDAPGTAPGDAPGTAPGDAPGTAPGDAPGDETLTFGVF